MQIKLTTVYKILEMLEHKLNMQGELMHSYLNRVRAGGQRGREKREREGAESKEGEKRGFLTLGTIYELVCSNSSRNMLSFLHSCGLQETKMNTKLSLLNMQLI